MPAKNKDESESDVRVITRAVYRMNGEGYLDFDHPGPFLDDGCYL